MPKTHYSFVLLEGTTEHPVRIRVDAWVPCGNGKKFEGIAFVDKPCTGQPFLSFPKPFGANGIMSILELLRDGINTSDIIDPR